MLEEKIDVDEWARRLNSDWAYGVAKKYRNAIKEIGMWPVNWPEFASMERWKVQFGTEEEWVVKSWEKADKLWQSEFGDGAMVQGSMSSRREKTLGGACQTCLRFSGKAVFDCESSHK